MRSRCFLFSLVFSLYFCIPAISQSSEITIFCAKGKPRCSNGRKARCSGGYQPRCVKGEPQLKPDCCKKVFKTLDNDPDFLKCKPSLLRCKKNAPDNSTDTGIPPTCENGVIKCSTGTPSCSNDANLGQPTCITLPSGTLPGCQSTEGFYAEEATCNTTVK